MEEKHGNPKPLRTSSGNKIKDLHNAYFKNEGSRNIPIDLPSEDLKMDLDEILESIEENEENIKTNEGSNLLINEIEEFRVKLSVVEKERDDFKEQVVRRTAELENANRRHVKEKLEMIDYANEKLLFKFLPVLDDLYNAVEAAKSTNEADYVVKGIEMILQKTLRLLEEEGVKPITDVVGFPFDVNLHEAMMLMPSEIPEGHIVQEILKGYMLRDKVLRHTKVITSSGESQE